MAGQGTGNPPFKLALGALDASSRRTSGVEDIVSRAALVSPQRVRLVDYPASVQAVFNASLAPSREAPILYSRVVVGYYRYLSAIASFKIPLEEVEQGKRSGPRLLGLEGRLEITPSSPEDWWGAEDPRATLVDGRTVVAYTGRTIEYFSPSPRGPRTLTVLRSPGEKGWRLVYTPRLGRGYVLVSQKNGFLVRVGSSYWFFHRLHIVSKKSEALGARDEFIAVVSRVEPPWGYEGRVEVSPEETWILLVSAGFERKVGWAAPLHVEGGRAIVLFHGVGLEKPVYRVSALEVELGGEPVVTAITPEYIMEPRLVWEKYGDTPYVVYPCGALGLGGGEVLVSYGAADTFTGIGVVDLNTVMGLLDRGRIY